MKTRKEGTAHIQMFVGWGKAASKIHELDPNFTFLSYSKNGKTWKRILKLVTHERVREKKRERRPFEKVCMVMMMICNVCCGEKSNQKCMNLKSTF